MSGIRVPLGDVAEFINGLAFSPDDWTETGRQIIRIQNLTDPTKPFNRTQRVVDAKYEVAPGELLVSWSATLGVFQWFGPDTALVNQHIFRVAPDSRRVDSQYLRHMLTDALMRMESHLHGATMKHVNRKEFLATEIPLPPLPAQKRIAAILDAADALRAKRRESIEQLDSLVQATFLEMFGDPVKNPNRWEIKTCDDICTKVTDGEHGSVERLPSGRLYLMARNVTACGEIDLGEVSFISEADHRRIFQRCDPAEGDLLLVCVGATIGKTAIVPEMPEFSLARSVALLKPRRNLVQPAYLNQYLRSRHGQIQLLHSRNTAAQSGLYLGKIKAMSIPLPPLDLQTRFASIVESIEQQKTRLKAHLAELDTLFASLQSRAFNGELVA